MPSMCQGQLSCVAIIGVGVILLAKEIKFAHKGIRSSYPFLVLLGPSTFIYIVFAFLATCALYEVQNGHFPATRSGSSAEVMCDSGYSIVTYDKATCTDNGWTIPQGQACQSKYFHH